MLQTEKDLNSETGGGDASRISISVTQVSLETRSSAVLHNL